MSTEPTEKKTTFAQKNATANKALVIRRKKTKASRIKSEVDKKLPGGLIPNTTFEAIFLYVNGTPMEEIAEKLSWKLATVSGTISKFYSEFKRIYETERLVKASLGDSKSESNVSTSLKTYSNQKSIDKDINKLFLEKLSGVNDTVLTEEEILFCYLLVHEGDERNALISSGLSEGLTKSGRGYTRAIKLRILMLKGKKNLIKYISNLQISYAKEMNLSKETIQSEIISQLRQLKEQNDPRNASTIAKLTEQLGRTVGAFSDKIVIEEISMDEAMNKMLEMRKTKGTAKTIEPASGTYVYDPEDIK